MTDAETPGVIHIKPFWQKFEYLPDGGCIVKGSLVPKPGYKIHPVFTQCKTPEEPKP